MNNSELNAESEIIDAVRHRSSRIFQRLAYFVLNPLIRSTSSTLRCEGLEALVEMKKSAPQGKKPVFIHVGRHLSELDWAEAKILMDGHGLDAVVSMGDNLDFGLIGGFLKAMGGFVALRQDKKVNGHNVDRIVAGNVYKKYFRNLVLSEERDVLIYPEMVKQKEGQRKYGRSYSGELLEFSALIFHFVSNLQKYTERPIFIVPHCASRERVVEDQMFEVLKNMKEVGKSDRLVYTADFGFISAFPFLQKPGAVEFRFGEPIYADSISARELARIARCEVAKLQTLFPTHVLAYSVGDRENIRLDHLEKDFEDSVCYLKSLGIRINHCFGNHESSGSLGPRYGIERALRQFDQPGRRVVSIKDLDYGYKELCVLMPQIFRQYRDNARSIVSTISN